MQIKRIESANPIPEAPHKLHVVLRVVVDTPAGPVEKCREVPVRGELFHKLGPKTPPFNAKQLAYVTKCHRLHHLEDRAVRAEFDADDQAVADAAAAAAKAIADAAAEEARQAELAKFIVTPQGFVRNKEGEVIGVQAVITHQGHTCTANIGLVSSLAKENALAAWNASKEAADAEANALAAFAVSG